MKKRFYKKYFINKNYLTRFNFHRLRRAGRSGGGALRTHHGLLTGRDSRIWAGHGHGHGLPVWYWATYRMKRLYWHPHRSRINHWSRHGIGDRCVGTSCVEEVVEECSEGPYHLQACSS